MPENEAAVSKVIVNAAVDDPKLIFNDWENNRKVNTTICHELDTCKRFSFSVAFITSGGLACILQNLDNNQNDVTGRIITTDYLNFSEPKALRTLLGFKNIKIKVYTKSGFHTKGYLFYRDNSKTLIVGSSNITQDALTKNKEWNVCVSSEALYTPIVEETEAEFESMWRDADELTEQWIANYEPRYIKAKIKRDQQLFSEYPDIKKPNSMQ